LTPAHSSLRNSLLVLKLPQRVKPKLDPQEIDRRFNQWLDALLQFHIKHFFDNHFEKWFGLLIEAFADDRVVRLLSYIDDLYKKAETTQPGIVLGNYQDNAIIINPANMGSHDDYERMSDRIRQNPDLISAMIMDLGKLVQYVLDHNTLMNHLNNCWPRIVSRFIESIKLFERDKAIAKFRIIEALKHSNQAEKNWPGFLICEYEALAIYYRRNSVVVMFNNQKTVFGIDAIIEDEFAAFVQSTIKIAPYAWFHLPVTVGQVKEMLIKNNAQPGLVRIK